MKTVLFVPGFGEDLTTKDHLSMMQAIARRGYRTVFVPITWHNTVIKNWVRELDDVYADYAPRETILAGFSAGAMTAFVGAASRNPSQLWLFSLSPYFAEDLQSPLMDPRWIEGIGPRRVEAARHVHFGELVTAIECPTLLLCGQVELNEWPIMEARMVTAHQQLQNSRCAVALGARHDVTSKPYIAAIEAAV